MRGTVRGSVVTCLADAPPGELPQLQPLVLKHSTTFSSLPLIKGTSEALP